MKLRFDPQPNRRTVDADEHTLIARGALRQLIRAYLYDGYLEMDYMDAWQAVDDFARLETALAPQLRTEVDDLLRSSRSEAEIRTLIVNDLKCAYRPDEDGWTYRSWLEGVADRVDHVLQFPAELSRITAEIRM
jgi:hypothetical protein